ncbi:30S ribosomal protein 3 [Nymphaea thermarum]|nr:30S ribosomal protein 3 [Nymphaea thermarum]
MAMLSIAAPATPASRGKGIAMPLLRSLHSQSPSFLSLSSELSHKAIHHQPLTTMVSCRAVERRMDSHKWEIRTAAAEAAQLGDPSATLDPEPEEQKEKLKVVVNPLKKPRLVLKFIWLEKNIGLALDQVIPGHGTIPLSPYYFWPRKDAWEELKAKLESKPWISQKRMIILLNQATDIINLWQQSGGNLQ